MIMTRKDYYTAPKQIIFDEIKRVAMALWSTYDDTCGYATEKINQIKDIKNIKDNTGFIVAMFDSPNQAIMRSRLNGEVLIWFDDLMEFAKGG